MADTISRTPQEFSRLFRCKCQCQFLYRTYRTAPLQSASEGDNVDIRISHVVTECVLRC